MNFYIIVGVLIALAAFLELWVLFINLCVLNLNKVHKIIENKCSEHKKTNFVRYYQMLPCSTHNASRGRDTFDEDAPDDADHVLSSLMLHPLEKIIDNLIGT